MCRTGSVIRGFHRGAVRVIERPPVTRNTLIATIVIGIIAVGVELFLLFRHPTSTINWIAPIITIPLFAIGCQRTYRRFKAHH